MGDVLILGRSARVVLRARTRSPGSRWPRLTLANGEQEPEEIKRLPRCTWLTCRPVRAHVATPNDTRWPRLTLVNGKQEPEEIKRLPRCTSLTCRPVRADGATPKDSRWPRLTRVNGRQEPQEIKRLSRCTWLTCRPVRADGATPNDSRWPDARNGEQEPEKIKRLSRCTLLARPPACGRRLRVVRSTDANRERSGAACICGSDHPYPARSAGRASSVV